MPKSSKPPKYALHKASGQAVVRVGGRKLYLGPYGSPKSRDAYANILRQIEAANASEANEDGKFQAVEIVGKPDKLTVAKIMVKHIEHATTYYRRSDGTPTTELRCLKESLRWLKPVSKMAAADFGPLALKSVRESMVKGNLCRKTVNSYIGRIKRMFGWATENELIPPSVYHGLLAVKGLRQGRSEAREHDPITTVPDAFVDAIESFVSPQVWAMIQLQRLTGARPGEVCDLRTMDLNKSGETWLYCPPIHKGSWRGHKRTIYVNLRAQAILSPWLRMDLEAYVFSPKEWVDQRNAIRRQNRKSPMTPSQAKRQKKLKPGWEAKEKYTNNSYRRAIHRGCDLAGVPRWSPNRLRHNAATEARKKFGIEAARLWLGHKSAVTSEIYAEADIEKAAAIANKIG